MHFAAIIENDIVDSKDGICTSLWFQGCNHLDVGWSTCPGCHNIETWNITGGEIVDNDIIIEKLLNILPKPIMHRLSILGGEPLMPENRKDCDYIISKIKEKYPDIIIYCWTGYKLGELISLNDHSINNILKNITYLIDGPFIKDDRNIKLTLRGSSNQHIYQNINGNLVDVTSKLESY